MPKFSPTIGTPGVNLATSYINLVLYTVEVCLAFHYMRQTLSSKSGWKPRQFCRSSRVFLMLSIVMDTTCTIAICAHFGYYIAGIPITYKTWTLPTYILTTYWSGAIEHAYLIFRYWSFSHNKVITGILCCCTASHTLFPTITILMSLTLGTTSNPHALSYAVLIASSISAFTDIMIAVVSLWTFRFATVVYDSTRSLLRRFTLLTLTSGCLSGVFTVLAAIMSVVNLNGYLFIFQCLGRIYTLTLIMNCLFTLTVQTDDEDEDGDSQNMTRDRDGTWSMSRSHGGRRRRRRRGDGITGMGIGRGVDSGIGITSHVMSHPRTHICSSHLDPLRKPPSHVPTFSFDSFEGSAVDSIISMDNKDGQEHSSHAEDSEDCRDKGEGDDRKEQEEQGEEDEEESLKRTSTASTSTQEPRSDA